MGILLYVVYACNVSIVLILASYCRQECRHGVRDGSGRRDMGGLLMEAKLCTLGLKFIECMVDNLIYMQLLGNHR